MRTNRPAIRSLLIALIVVVGMTVPAVAVSAGPHETTSPGQAVLGAIAAQETPENNSSVNVTVGQQLATVIGVSSDEVQTEFENTAFELAVEGESDEAQAEAIADRADALRERAEAIREDYEDATEAYEDGELTKSEYAQRLASLNARSSNLISSYERLSQRAQNVSGLELRAAGANLSSLDSSLENLSSVTGPGSSALLAQFLGEADGEIELETADGLKIEIEREGGEASREFERPRDDDMNITVSHADALQTARGALSAPDEGRWVLTESKIKSLEGAYEFEFVLSGAANLTGEAEVRVDGSTGEIYRLEQETERPDHDDEADEQDEFEEEEDDEHDELTLIVTAGTPEPNATVTVQVLADGQPVEDATISINDHSVGTTDANGTVDVRLPDASEVELTAEHGEAEGELEFEFDDAHEHETERVFERLDVTASLDDGNLTVGVRFDGEPVRNATVYANDHRVGKTDSDGVVTFAFDESATDELELEVVKGAFEAELEYAIQDGSLVLIEEEHEGDGDKAEHDDGDEREADDAAEEEDDRPEEDEEEDDREDDEDHDRSLELSVVHGTAEPGATVTVEVSADGEPVEGATVTVDGSGVGETDANGILEVTLPDDDSVDLRAEYGDLDARLEFDFDDEETDETETEEA